MSVRKSSFTYTRGRTQTHGHTVTYWSLQMQMMGLIKGFLVNFLFFLLLPAAFVFSSLDTTSTVAMSTKSLIKLCSPPLEETPSISSMISMLGLSLPRIDWISNAASILPLIEAPVRSSLIKAKLVAC